MTRLFGIALCALLICALLPMVTAQVHAEGTVFPYKIDEANFPNEAFRKYVADNIDDGDNVLTEAEAKAVTKIEFVGLTSKDDPALNMKGIQYFTNLEELSCGGNFLTSLDLTANTKLTYLNAYDNNIKVIDLSKNTALTEVYLGNNQLGALDVSKNTKLEYLDVCNFETGTNNLKELDVSKNTKLIGLGISRNKITSLDISNNLALQYLYCEDNAISSLDVTKHKNLIELFCCGNTITKLDITNTKVFKEGNDHGWFGAHSGGKTVTVTMTQEQLDAYKASPCYKTDDNDNKGVKVHVHEYTNFVARATATKAGYTCKKCECGHIINKKAIPAVKTIKLSPASSVYNGKKVTPEVIVKDSEGKKLVKGTDYTVSYSEGRKNIGTYKVTVVLKGNYTGSQALTLTIRPPKTAITKVSALKGGFKVKWEKKSKYSDGYQIEYSLKENFSKAKTVTISKTGTTSTTVKNLKNKKVYYVRVRTYTNVNGKKVGSTWSAAKKIKTK